MIRNCKVLVTGATGMAAFPLAGWLAAENEVWGAGRLSTPASRAKLISAGIKPCAIDLERGDLSDNLRRISITGPRKVDYHAAMRKLVNDVLELRKS